VTEISIIETEIPTIVIEISMTEIGIKETETEDGINGIGIETKMIGIGTNMIEIGTRGVIREEIGMIEIKTGIITIEIEMKGITNILRINLVLFHLGFLMTGEMKEEITETRTLAIIMVEITMVATIMGEIILIEKETKTEVLMTETEALMPMIETRTEDLMTEIKVETRIEDLRIEMLIGHIAQTILLKITTMTKRAFMGIVHRIFT
jgi:hypothetical protein